MVSKKKLRLGGTGLKTLVLISKGYDTNKSICKKLGRSKSTISGVIKILKNKGFVIQRKDKSYFLTGFGENHIVGKEFQEQYKRLLLSKKENQKASRIKNKYNISYSLYKKKTEKCFVCGFKQGVHIHHIDSDKNNYSEKNLIGLCANHHQLIHSKKAVITILNGELLYIIKYKKW